MHSHGASLREVWNLRYNRFDRYVDCVLYPSEHDHVVKIVELAKTYGVMVVPYGGGTNVTQALYLQRDSETGNTKMIVSLDMHRMNKILWIDKKNMLACA